MIGAAIEGVWIELAKALFHFDRSNARLKKLNDGAVDPHTGIAMVVRDTTRVLEDRGIVGSLLRDTEVTLSRMRELAAWTNLVRESRNALHWGAEPTIPNDFQKAAIMMMTAAEAVSVLWRIRNRAITVNEQDGV